MTKFGNQVCVFMTSVADVVKVNDILERHRSNKNITISTMDSVNRYVTFRTSRARYDKIVDDMTQSKIIAKAQVMDSFGRPMWKEL